MLRLINVRVNSDKTITINNPIQIRQGDFNVVKLVINPSLYIKDLSKLRGNISFKRADNKQSGQVLLTQEGDTFTYVLKDPWLVDIAGQLWFTISFDRIDKRPDSTVVVQERIYAGNASLYINPDANYTIGDYIPPTESEELHASLEYLDERVTTLEDNMLNKDFTTYPSLGWDEVENRDLVILNKIDRYGNVSQYSAEAKDLYNSVNNIRPDDEGNIELDASNIPYNNTNVSDALYNKMDASEPVLFYSEMENTQEPITEITRADYATGDQYGNNIYQTYANKTETNNELSRLEQDKQDNISVNGVGLSFNNNIISLKTSDLIFTGGFNSSGTEEKLYSVPLFEPTHYLINYYDLQGEVTGSVMISADTLLGYPINTCVSKLASYSAEGDFTEVRHFVTIQFKDNYIISGGLVKQTLTLTKSGSITHSETAKALLAKVYAIRL